MPYERYRNSDTPTEQLLFDCHINRLPVDLDAICEQLGVCVLSYDAGAEIIERAHLYRAVRHNDGLTFYWRDTPVILFNEARELPQLMFTIAHELGHVVLQHITPNETHSQLISADKETKRDISKTEAAANQFAVHLLAPACVLWGLGAYTSEKIMSLCQLPRQEAEYSAQRVAELVRQKKIFACPVEFAVYRQFQPYIARASPACDPHVFQVMSQGG